jgi:hypothetical protein
MTQEKQLDQKWPAIFNRYMEQFAQGREDLAPRQVARKFHGMEVDLWLGKIHVDEIEGWVENTRLIHFLSRWHKRRGGNGQNPTTDDIYDIMVEADKEESRTSKKPFHIERMAENIGRNGIQEPVVVYLAADGSKRLWDGNRRFYGTKHIMRDPDFAAYRDQAQWVPAYLYVASPTDPARDNLVMHKILTELNFLEKDHIPWPAYVKAGVIHGQFLQDMAADPNDPALSRYTKERISRDFGLKGWRQADRWIKMYDLAQQFKEYHEEEHGRSEVEVDLRLQEKFEYFDELSKPGVWGALSVDADARDEVFRWLWDGKFQAFTDVRMVPKILNDPIARRKANEGYDDAVKDAIKEVLANDTMRTKDRSGANERITFFGEWLNGFQREDYKKIKPEVLELLRGIVVDTVKILEGLQSGEDIDAPHS